MGLPKRKKRSTCTPKRAKTKANAKAKQVRCRTPKRGSSARKAAPSPKGRSAPTVKRPSTVSRPAAPLGGAAVLPVPDAAAAPAPPPAPPAPLAAPASTPPAVPRRGDVPSPGGFGPAEASRLLWRAGFGPAPGEVEELVALGLDAAVDRLLQGRGEPRLVGPEPRDEAGAPLDPVQRYGHDHLAWLDRMVRTTHPLQERMALVWHDWFAVSHAKVHGGKILLDHVAMLRRLGLGRFDDLLDAVSTDPAMLLYLDRLFSTRTSPNENYAREVMELHTLGAGRAAYTEQDVRELARAYTGWVATWSGGQWQDFRWRADLHDAGTKTILGRSGRFDGTAANRLLLDHELHASFFVTKLWSAFVPTPPDQATQAALQDAYVTSGRQVAPVLRRIFTHPDFLHGPAMVLPPVVLNAGLLRAVRRAIDTSAWWWLSGSAGQQLLLAPTPAGWSEDRWLSSSTWRWRFNLAVTVLSPLLPDPWAAARSYPRDETPAQAVDKALQLLGNPILYADTRAELLRYAEAAVPRTGLDPWTDGHLRAARHNGLCFLVASCAEAQTS